MTAASTPQALHMPERIGPGRFVLVVGPSGAGKDTLIAKAKAKCGQDSSVVFPRRVVTRPASATEDHDSLTEAEFDAAAQNGAFAVAWQAHGLKYGIPVSVDDALRCGRTIVCNVSRAIVDLVRDRYQRVVVVLVTAPAETLSARLLGRARENDTSLAERVQRNEDFAEFLADYAIENIGEPDAGAQRLLDVICAK